MFGLNIMVTRLKKKKTFKKMDDHIFSIILKCCDVSSCGNFNVVGYNDGQFTKYNLQSGMERGTMNGKSFFMSIILICRMKFKMKIFFLSTYFFYSSQRSHQRFTHKQRKSLYNFNIIR